MSEQTAQPGALPEPIIVTGGEDRLEEMLGKEWLLTNGIGAYASSTAAGCNTRRYHGLLIGATMPPVGRVVGLSTVMEQLIVGQTEYQLATNEFAGSFSPRGICHLECFVNDIYPRFVFRAADSELTKEIILAEAANAVAVQYRYHGPPAVLILRPFASCRDYHHLRKVSEPHQMTFQQTPRGVTVQDRLRPACELHLQSETGSFEPAPQWWYKFRYRADIARGQEGFEDLYTPGTFRYELTDGDSCELTASLNEPIVVHVETTRSARRERLAGLAGSVGPDADETTRRLALASDTFVVQRSFPNAPSSGTILAGYHWFADWGRDAFIALPGLLLSTGRFDKAREVFRTFANSLSNGMIPSRFDDYSATAHYNSIDASLWFIIAAQRYLQATEDTAFWRDTLMPAANAILTAYNEGTKFDIRADADGLLTGGSADTQLTWMDAALGTEVVTPRHGKAVEVNALWHSAHRIMAERCADVDPELSAHYAQQAELIGQAFAKTFWNAQAGCLYDVVLGAVPDATLRPNQILAVSLPYCPLGKEQQEAVVRVVQERLLTPFGLQSLCREDPRYRRRYGSSWESRDRAYHQGTVWAWLIGPFIEAYLNVSDNNLATLAQATKWLEAFESHLYEAGLGTISEIFDGDPPHGARGCIAQAWSVAEVLRIKCLIRQRASAP